MIAADSERCLTGVAIIVECAFDAPPAPRSTASRIPQDDTPGQLEDDLTHDAGIGG